MRFDQDLAIFMASPVMIILGSCSHAGVPQIGRSIGAVVDAEKGSVDLLVSAWQWPATLANVRENGRLAVTFARPADYVSYQVKGRATLVPLERELRRRSAWYVGAMTEVLVGLGLDPVMMAAWLVDREPAALRLQAEAVFWQTPGAKAGRQLGAQA